MIEITTADLRSLLNETNNERPALYVKLDEDTHAPSGLEVWAEALTPAGSVVITQEDLMDAVGEDPDAELLDEMIPDLQTQIEEICDGF